MRIIIEVDDQKAGQGAPEILGTAPGGLGTADGATDAGAAPPPPGPETMIDGVIVMNAGPAPDHLAGPVTGGIGDAPAAEPAAGADGSLSAGPAPELP